MNDLNVSTLSTDELNKLKKKLEYDIAKYNNFQMARKIAANSLYGALGTPYFRYYNVNMAEAVTLTGQYTIQFIENKVNLFLNKLLKTDNIDYIIACDTDSVYINFEAIVNKTFKDKTDDKLKITKFLDKTCNDVIQPVIDDAIKSAFSYLNTITNTIEMKREVIASKALWVAKKRYIMNYYAKEGVFYTEPKFKITGIEAIRSSTPEICRNKIKQCIELILNGTEKDVIEFIQMFKVEFFKQQLEDISFPRTLNNLQKYQDSKTIFKKGTPISVKSALLYNFWLIQKKLLTNYDLLREGDKMKFVYLREPNVIHSSVIGFNTVLPKEFLLHENINYELQFEKTFIDPVKKILDIIGWKTEKKRSLFDDD